MSGVLTIIDNLVYISFDIQYGMFWLFGLLQLTETRFTPKIITNGSIITLQHIHGRDCWLHSHNLLYPKRSVPTCTCLSNVLQLQYVAIHKADIS